ncbi:HlyD family efflux transporter periplasmic adaptor subunit [Acinetobacter qingfengensis]|uniref:Efflux transporter periplasmic adaptor subunit n=1 Tax=Acinetobacter qingfengensis TaxID=1262585 RepID=A0A1E7RDN6_9GAMM|nr:HlyD family efflux transporter periplasmic adaptor subunit [Acinetobacter qingfengensis]KAA8735282.1 HlyD family efflux transporter periplasmic adaptor subunit [Acinetobacter qingfengensis]OEY97403.1 efflux transporter periplasmic adaptor subunit [Acinetobacter qingfengensis]
MSDAQQQSPDVQSTSGESLTLQQKRKKTFKIFAIILIIIALIYAGWLWWSSNDVDTDNAYVGADSAAITSMVNAQVRQVFVRDTQQIHQGDILVQLDDRDAKIALAQAEAQLAKAQRQFKQSKANSNALDSQVFVSADAIASAKAEVNKAQADYNKALDDLNRRQQLVNIGGVSKEDLTSAQAAANTAKAALDVAKANLAQTQSSRKAAQSNFDASNALIQGSTENDTPDVLVAKASVEQAKLDLERTIIRAPIDGIVAQRNVQVGQRLAAGNVIMKIVPIQQLYVDANFKESQLANVRVGQSVKLTSDYYGSDVVYHGKVVGFSGGTGAAFALIPAQNATGNWIKVVQRLPVRIQLDPKELSEHPLRVGLSMTATIDLASR